ncbi:MAG TPA: Rab family GTPase [Candidatus Lokiarchaeia archaeon]|nr:Rab family GTPase [Candidatus Lokiarchaeia archaeon]
MGIIFKLIIFGDGAVGKTTFHQRYITGLFSDSTPITIGVQVGMKEVVVNGIEVSLQIWDLGGEDRFRFILPTYCSGARGAIFMYDITAPHTLTHLAEWMEVIQDRLVGMPLLLLGTKADLAFKRRVYPEEANEAMKRFNFSEAMEVSAKTGQNVNDAFQTITRLMLEQMIPNSPIKESDASVERG